jgi:hypothetical protein
MNTPQRMASCPPVRNVAAEPPKFNEAGYRTGTNTKSLKS